MTRNPTRGTARRRDSRRGQGSRGSRGSRGFGPGVGDLGTGRWQPLPCDPSAEYGRGLLLVMALADGIGHDATPGQRHRTWAEVTW